MSGVRVVPPTSTTSSISLGLRCASASACFTGPMVRSTIGLMMASKSARVKSCAKTAPPGSGNRTLAVCDSESSCFAVDQRFAKFLREFRLRGNIDAVMLQDFRANQRLQSVVDVVATEVRVAVG